MGPLRRSFTLLAAVFLLVGVGVTREARSERPNILLIMADDMGYGDPQCYNSDSRVPTPNIDRLARDGVRFTDAHAPAAVCVPTRYGLLTGRYPFRMTKRRGGSLIEPGQMTLASLLKGSGYATGCVGKWHLGFEGEKNPPADRPLRGGPLDHGFDEYFGIPASLDIPPYYYIDGDRCVAPPSEKVEASNSPGWSRIQGAFWREGGIAPGYKHSEVLGKFTRKSIDYLENHAKDSPKKPFFLYLALAAPHTPWLPGEPFLGKSEASMYGDFVHQVDHAVGQVLDTLDRLEVADSTLVIFTSDNGPVWFPEDVEKYGHSSVGKLRGMKGDAWEGGHRMPFLARWPGRTRAGTVSDEVICHVDLLSTFSAILGEPLPRDQGGDSFNILPALLGEKLPQPIREATVFQSSRGVLSIRQGPWKLIPALGSGGFSEPRVRKPEEGESPGQLYNLVKDPSETKNLYGENPSVVERLTVLLERYQKDGHSR